MMKWTKTGMVLGVLAAGWWMLQRTSPAAADGGTGSPAPSSIPSNPDPGMVRSFSNPDPKMVVTLPNPDPKMVITPPWPRDNTQRGTETAQQ